MGRGKEKQVQEAPHAGQESMRLDKYLKVSRIIKRRTVADEACDGGRVLVNGKEGKSGMQVKAGDKLEIRFGSQRLLYEIVSVSEHAPKAEAGSMYKLLGGSEDA